MDISQNSKSDIGYFPQACVCDEGDSVELGADFSLPDYQPEIRRLLSSRAYLAPPSEYVGNSSSQIDGDVIYKILYLGADGRLYSSTLTDKYSISVPISLFPECVDADSIELIPFIGIGACNVRVTGPRRLNVHSRVSCRALAFSPALYSPSSSGAHDISEVEHLVLEAPHLSAAKCTGEPFVLTDTLAIESPSESARIVDVQISPTISECISSAGCVSIRGEALARVLYCNDDESDKPLSLTRRIPFTSKISCSAATSDSECFAQAYVSEEEIGMEEGEISICFTLTPCATVQASSTVSYIADAYSTECKTECTTREIPTASALKCSGGALSCNDIISLEEIKLSGDAALIDVFGTSVVDETTLEAGKLTISGYTSYQIVYCLDGEYASCEARVPFRYSADCRTSAGSARDMRCIASAQCISTRARSDGERLFLDSELSFCIWADLEMRLTGVSEIIFGEPLQRQRAQMTLCYPQRDATLWSIGKHYGVRCATLMEKNSLSREELPADKKFLII